MNFQDLKNDLIRLRRNILNLVDKDGAYVNMSFNQKSDLLRAVSILDRMIDTAGVKASEQFHLEEGDVVEYYTEHPEEWTKLVLQMQRRVQTTPSDWWRRLRGD